MKFTVLHFKNIFTGFCLIGCCTAFASDSLSCELKAYAQIEKLYHTLGTMPNRSITDRLDWISQQFMGRPYLLGALGEGEKGRYDQYPRYRVDAFDCETYVDTVLALALANSASTFTQCINSIRYKDGKVSYINRNHFTSIDWNINNQKMNRLKDITLTIHDQQNKPVAVYAEALINKPNWYARKNNSSIRLEKAQKGIAAQRLSELVSKGKKLPSAISKIAYIPLRALFSRTKKPNYYLFSQIPNGSIIEIVRPNWDVSSVIGTNLNVSHLGFGIWRNKQLYFRNASSQDNKVMEVLLTDYLKKAISSPTIKGINIQVIVPIKISPSGDC